MPHEERGEEMTLRREVRSVHVMGQSRGRLIHGLAKGVMSEEEVEDPSHILVREQVCRGGRSLSFHDGVGDLGVMLFAGLWADQATVWSLDPPLH